MNFDIDKSKKDISLAEMLWNRRVLGKFILWWLFAILIAGALSFFFSPRDNFNQKNELNIATSSTQASTKNSPQQNSALNLDIPAPKILPERIKIDSIGVDARVLNPNTTNIKILDKSLMNGAVRYPTSGYLGEKDKNMVIFGHSTYLPGYYGAYRTFNGVEKLKEGDVILVKAHGKDYVYRVSRRYMSNSKTGEIMLNARNNKLTLVTCNGFGKKSDRWVVEADFVGAVSEDE